MERQNHKRNHIDLSNIERSYHFKSAYLQRQNVIQFTNINEAENVQHVDDWKNNKCTS